MSSSGGVRSVSSRFQPCLRAVSSTVRRTAWFCAPVVLRKLPEIFCCTLRGRSARSASLLVAGTVGSRVNRSTPSRLSRSRRTRLWPRRRFRRPRRPFVGGGGRDSCQARPPATMLSARRPIWSASRAGRGFPSDRFTAWMARRSRRAIVAAQASSSKSTRSWSSRRRCAAQRAGTVPGMVK